MRKWDCRHTFVLTAGEFNVAAESNLTKKGVRRTPEPGQYRFSCTVEAESELDAAVAAKLQLDSAVGPYGVQYDVYESSVIAVR